MPDKLILITNDDGIESPGLRAAAETVAGLGKIIIAAPSTQQTAMSRALCGAKNEYFRLIDFPVEQNNITAYHIDASPAMTVQHAYNVLFNERKPDLIISGINYGENLGWDSMLSGTLGAAFQGASQGTPSIAVSLQTLIENHFHYGQVDWNGSKHFLKIFAKKILTEGIPEKAKVLKIDVPADADESTEWKYTKLANHHHFTAEIKNPNIESKLGDAKIKVRDYRHELNKGTDIYTMVIDNLVSVTPLGMDLSV